MKKNVKIAFVIFNIIYFFVDYILVTVLPNPILFGWLPLQLCILLFFTCTGSYCMGTLLQRLFQNTGACEVAHNTGKQCKHQNMNEKIGGLT